MSTLSTPNRVVWEYFDSLRQLVRRANTATSKDRERQAAALAVVMSVTVVEVFLNLWFRVRLEERHSAQELGKFLKELNHPRPASLDFKLRNWPNRYFQVEVNFELSPWKQFMAIKSLRNSIVHFTSSHETFEFENIMIHGLTDTSEYDELSRKQAGDALQAAEQMVMEIFRMAQVAEDQVPHLLHGWTGKVPSLGGNVV